MRNVNNMGLIPNVYKCCEQIDTCLHCFFIRIANFTFWVNIICWVKNTEYESIVQIKESDEEKNIHQITFHGRVNLKFLDLRLIIRIVQVKVMYSYKKWDLTNFIQ